MTRRILVVVLVLEHPFGTAEDEDEFEDEDDLVATRTLTSNPNAHTIERR